MGSEPTKKVLAYHSVIQYVEDLSKLSARIVTMPIGPRYPVGDPDHDPRPVYHISVILEEES